MPSFNGLGLHLGNLSRLSAAQTRSISAENPTGEKGKGGSATEGTGAAMARELGRGFKISPSIQIGVGETALLADIAGSGAIQQIWMTLNGKPRFAILRIYWDGSPVPAVECPLGDFFACGWEPHAQVSSLAVCVNPKRGFNCYWEMPFRKRCVVTLTNISSESMTLYYQLNYVLTDVSEDSAYFHAQFRRSNPLPYKEVHTLLDGVKGRGHYVGTYMTWGSNNSGWWGEGEIKFYMDGDREFPTICGTGTEDYFGGAWNFDSDGYTAFTTPYTGLPQILRPDGLYASQLRFGMYRWHIVDPIRFEADLRVTIQALGWHPDGYVPLRDDIGSVAFWYQTLPAAPFPQLPDKNTLAII